MRGGPAGFCPLSLCRFVLVVLDCVAPFAPNVPPHTAHRCDKRRTRRCPRPRRWTRPPSWTAWPPGSPQRPTMSPTRGSSAAARRARSLSGSSATAQARTASARLATLLRVALLFPSGRHHPPSAGRSCPGFLAPPWRARRRRRSGAAGCRPTCGRHSAPRLPARPKLHRYAPGLPAGGGNCCAVVPAGPHKAAGDAAGGHERHSRGRRLRPAPACSRARMLRTRVLPLLCHCVVARKKIEEPP